MATYPTIIQRPYTRTLRFLTQKTDMESGLRYALPLMATPLRAWDIEYSALTDAEMATLTNFFLARGGRFDTFTFVDPEDSVSYAKCRFGMDDLSPRSVQRDQNQVRVTIEEFA